MAKMTTEDLHNLTSQVEEIEKIGGEAFARHALTRRKGSAEVVPAREFLAELAAKLGA